MPSEDDRELRAYLRDAQRVWDEVWNGVDVSGKAVIDVGIGDSTRRLVELGAEVVAIERDVKKIQKLEPNVPVLICDFLSFPFERRIADVVVFSFVLHEMNPEHHLKALSIAARMAPLTVIVEPVPRGCPEYEEFSRIWSRAMHSVGRFEDYKEPTYWENMLREVGFEIVLKRNVKWKVYVPLNVLGDIVGTTIEEWEEMGVPWIWIRTLLEFLRRKPRLKWSDVAVIVGGTNPSPSLCIP